MMRPSTTTSVFSYSQIWIRAFVCRNRKIRFCARAREEDGWLEWEEASAGARAIAATRARERDSGGGAEATATTGGAGTIGCVMMRWTLVAMARDV